jgi:NAD(P)-dependent dehydrogenase (short-subunit alcohol dehydrogenase family)
MKIIIVGASGKIGSKVAADFKEGNDIITAGSKTGDYKVDITSSESITAFFEKVGPFDALVSTVGKAHFGLLKDTTAQDFLVGLNDKLLGQINLVLIGQKYINKGGSFTLTSGILSDDPILYGSNLSTVNGGINSFVVAASIELENDVRINAVSPGVVEDSPEYYPYFPGHIPVKMNDVVNAYRKSVFGAVNGKVIKVF